MYVISFAYFRPFFLDLNGKSQTVNSIFILTMYMEFYEIHYKIHHFNGNHSCMENKSVKLSFEYLVTFACNKSIFKTYI